MADDKAKTLSDTDIATYARRGGPSHGAPGTDADAHVDTDSAAPTDQDTAKAAPAKPSSDADH